MFASLYLEECGMSKFVLAILCGLSLWGEGTVTLDITCLTPSPRGPAGFVQVEVLTPKGKRMISGFTSAQGVAHFRLPAGEYVVAARSNNVSQCQTGNIKWITQCSGQQRVALKAGEEATQVSVQLHAVERPAGAF
jgi:hypothetical protein